MSDRTEKKFERELQRWIDEDQRLFRSLWNWLLSNYNNFPWPRLRIWSIPHQLITLLLVASGPAIAYHTAEEISLDLAIYATLGLSFLLWGTALLERLTEKNSKRFSKPMQTIWVRFGDLLNTVKSGATAAGDKDASIEASLSIVASLAAKIVLTSPEQIAASLVLYQGSSYEKMRVMYRHRGSERPVRRNVRNIEKLLGHHACQNGPAPRVVPDIHSFGSIGRKSPTQMRPTYRSIFFHPVVSSSDGRLRGFISVDCTKPHAFHGHRADDLVALLEPLRAHIEDMI